MSAVCTPDSWLKTRKLKDLQTKLRWLAVKPSAVDTRRREIQRHRYPGNEERNANRRRRRKRKDKTKKRRKTFTTNIGVVGVVYREVK